MRSSCKASGNGASPYAQPRNHESTGNYPIQDALRPIMGSNGQFRHAPSSPLLDHTGWLVIWENHRGITHQTQVMGTKQLAESLMREILDGDQSHPSFAPVRRNMRVVPENNPLSIIQEDADGHITGIKIRN